VVGAPSDTVEILGAMGAVSLPVFLDGRVIGPVRCWLLGEGIAIFHWSVIWRVGIPEIDVKIPIFDRGVRRKPVGGVLVQFVGALKAVTARIRPLLKSVEYVPRAVPSGERADKDGPMAHVADYAVTYRDPAEFGLSLIDAVESRTDGETTILVTADHGHNLGHSADDRLVHHDGSASEGVLHVPLEVVNPPDGYPDRIDGLFSHLALGALVSDLSAGEPWDEALTREEIPAEVVGLGGTGDPRNYREFDEGEYEYWDRLIRCVYRADEQLEKRQWDSLGNRHRYRLDPERPCWQEEIEGTFDVQQAERTHFETSAVEFKRRASTDDGTSQSDGVVEERLRNLGYM
jgi:hypothetical protein